MKKFLRNLFSGYFLVLLILLIELGIFIFIQFFLEDVLLAIIGNTEEVSDVGVIVSLIYLLLRFVF